MLFLDNCFLLIAISKICSIESCIYLKKMQDGGPLASFDRIPAGSALRVLTSSIFGCLGTFGSIGVIIWMYFWAVQSYTKGNFFQSSFETQKSTNNMLQSPHDLRMAIVFYNKTSNAVANHTLLKAYTKPIVFQSNGNGDNIFYQSVTNCDPKYFSDAVNPVTFTDCFIFPKNKSVELSIINAIQSKIGYKFAFTCYSPFFCKTGGTTMTTQQNNAIAWFSNYSFTFYFSTRVLQTDGSFKHQVFYVPSSDYNTPYTITSTFNAELSVSNITIDYSELPWLNLTSFTTLSYFGNIKGAGVVSTALATAYPSVNVISSLYQYQIYRYYQKLDWLIGIIGGGAFLIIFACSCMCIPINKALFEMNASQQFLVEYPDDGPPENLHKVKSVSISYLYILFGWFWRNKNIDKTIHLLDISVLIKKLKVTERNLSKFNIKLYNKQRRLPQILSAKQPMIIQLGRNLQQSKGALIPNENVEPFIEIVHDDMPEQKEQKVKIQYKSIGNYVKSSQNKDNDKFNKIEENKEKQQQNKQNLMEGFEQLQANANYFTNNVVKEQSDVKSVFEKDQLPLQQVIVSQNLKKEKQLSKNIEKQQIKSELPKNDSSEQKRSDSKRNFVQDQIRNPPKANSVDAIIQSNYQQSLLNINPVVIKALKQSENTQQIYGVCPTIMILSNHKKNSEFQYQIQKYDYKSSPKNQSKCKSLISSTISLIRSLDIYGAKINFNQEPANRSLVGRLVTFLIIALAIVGLVKSWQLASYYKVFVSYDFLQPQDINYQVRTGNGFRPAICFNPSKIYSVVGSSQIVTVQFYSYTASNGINFLNTVKLGPGKQDLLGITPDSYYYSLDTSNCLVMSDNQVISMGGINTSQEAYFGFRITGFCSGAPSSCVGTANSNLISFLNTASNPFTLYLQTNAYDPVLNTIISNGVYPQNLKQGSNNFTTTLSVQQTLYIDQTRRLDSYSQRFLGSDPVVIEEVPSYSRYSSNQLTKNVNTSSLYYDCKILPSGKRTNIILTGNTFDVIIGRIGGMLFISYVIFFLLAKMYNNFNVRAKLAEMIYNDNSYEKSSLLNKFIHIFCCCPLKLFKGCTCGHDLQKMKIMDNKITSDLNLIDFVKMVQSCYRLSSAFYESIDEKLMSLIYFKENTDKSSLLQQKKEVKQFSSDYDQQQQSSNTQGNQHRPPESKDFFSKKHQFNQQQEKQKFQPSMSDQIDYVQLEEPFKNKSVTNTKWKEIVAFFDLFHSDAGFTLNQKTKIGSCCGFIFSLGTVAIVFVIFIYYIISFNNGTGQRISYLKGIETNFDSQPPLTLNSSNFRLALGFYVKPNFAFLNVSSLVNQTSDSNIQISARQISTQWLQNGTLIPTQTVYNLTACPSTYFDGFTSPNVDSSYYSNSLINAFCLPTNVALNLSANVLNNMQYFKIQIYNTSNSTNSITALQSLTSNYVLGVLMTVPVINTKNKTFNYTVQQIKPYNQILTKSIEVNITLTKQRITYTSPNYTADNNAITLENYNYISNAPNERLSNAAATTVPRIYNLTFSYSALVESYIVQTPSISQLFGYLGGIILVVTMILGFFAKSFNNFYKNYLIVKEVYVVEPYEKINNSKKWSKLKSSERLLLNESVNNISEIYVIFAWLISFLYTSFKATENNYKIYTILLLQSRIKSDLDLYNFYKRLFAVKDTVNREFKLKANQLIPVANIYEKQPAIGINQTFSISKGPLRVEASKHNLSSRDQAIISQSKFKLEQIYGSEYLLKIVKFELEPDQDSEHSRKEAPNNFHSYDNLANENKQISIQLPNIKSKVLFEVQHSQVQKKAEKKSQINVQQQIKPQQNNFYDLQNSQQNSQEMDS